MGRLLSRAAGLRLVRLFVDAFLCYLLAPGSPTPPRAPVLGAICLVLPPNREGPRTFAAWACSRAGVGSAARPTARLVLHFFLVCLYTFSELLVSGILGSLCATASTRPEFVLPTSTTELQPSDTVTNFARHGPKTSFSQGRVAAGLERRARAPRLTHRDQELET